MPNHDLLTSIRRIQIKTLREVQNLFAGSYHSVFKGHGLTFESIREYEPGDEVRYIDWNVTARSSTPFIKQFKEERELTVFLLVDISASNQFGTTQLKSELIAEIGAILAFSAIKNQDKIGLILFSSEIELFLPPKNNLKQVLRVIRELLYFKPKHKGTDFKKALSFFGKIQHKPCICFLISDFILPESECHLGVTAHKHDLIAIRVQDPWESTFPNMGIVELSDLETGERVLVDSSNKKLREFFSQKVEERDKKIHRELAKLGVDQIIINTAQPYQKVLHQFFKMRSRRR
jgi:uncharacterized protein (DUF58 family)